MSLERLFMVSEPIGKGVLVGLPGILPMLSRSDVSFGDTPWDCRLEME